MHATRNNLFWETLEWMNYLVRFCRIKDSAPESAGAREKRTLCGDDPPLWPCLLLVLLWLRPFWLAHARGSASGENVDQCDCAETRTSEPRVLAGPAPWPVKTPPGFEVLLRDVRPNTKRTPPRRRCRASVGECQCTKILKTCPSSLLHNFRKSRELDMCTKERRKSYTF